MRAARVRLRDVSETRSGADRDRGACADVAEFFHRDSTPGGWARNAAQVADSRGSSGPVSIRAAHDAPLLFRDAVRIEKWV